MRPTRRGMTKKKEQNKPSRSHLRMSCRRSRLLGSCYEHARKCLQAVSQADKQQRRATAARRRHAGDSSTHSTKPPRESEVRCLRSRRPSGSPGGRSSRRRRLAVDQRCEQLRSAPRMWLLTIGIYTRSLTVVANWPRRRRGPSGLTHSLEYPLQAVQRC